MYERYCWQEKEEGVLTVSTGLTKGQRLYGKIMIGIGLNACIQLVSVILYHKSNTVIFFLFQVLVSYFLGHIFILAIEHSGEA